jgi:hypothetical protein
VGFGKYPNLFQPTPPVLSLGAPARGGVDLGIAQYADKLAAVNWLHSKPGPQGPLLGTDTYFWHVMQSAQLSTVQTFSRLDIQVRVACSVQPSQKDALYANFGHLAVSGVCRHAPLE